MTRILPLALAAAALAATPTLANEEQQGFDENAVAAIQGDIVIEAPYAVSMKEGEIVVFMTIHNSAEAADAITGVSSEAAETAGLARYEGVGEDKKTEALDRIEAPGNEAVMLDLSGYHVVLTDLKKPVEGGDVIPLVLTFEETGDMKVEVSVAVMN